MSCTKHETDSSCPHCAEEAGRRAGIKEAADFLDTMEYCRCEDNPCVCMESAEHLRRLAEIEK